MQLFQKNLSKTAFIIDKISTCMLFFFLLVMTTATFAQVFCRYLLDFSIPWSEELSRFLFTWVVFAGIPSLIYRSGMTAFNLFLTRLTGWRSRIMSLIISTSYILFFYYLIKGSIPLVKRQMMQMATSIPIPMGVIYMVIPVSGIFAVIVILERLIHDWHISAEDI